MRVSLSLLWVVGVGWFDPVHGASRGQCVISSDRCVLGRCSDVLLVV